MGKLVNRENGRQVIGKFRNEKIGERCDALVAQTADEIEKGGQHAQTDNEDVKG